VPAGLSNVVAIAAGGYHSIALTSDGTLVEWGDQASWGGQIPAGLSNVVAMATGVEHNVAIIAGGTLAVWGANTYGQTNIPAGLSNVVAVVAGGWHTLALESNGTVVAWGAGVGSNTNVDYGQNIVPSGLSNVVQVAAGLVHSLALAGSAPPVQQASLTVNSFGTNGFNVTVPTRNGRVYQLEYEDSLTNQAWTALPLCAGTGGMLELNDPGASTTERFYQVSRW
jgi:alpha-tubulin suppressor-like RCC1 family protein